MQLGSTGVFTWLPVQAGSAARSMRARRMDGEGKVGSKIRSVLEAARAGDGRLAQLAGYDW